MVSSPERQIMSSVRNLIPLSAILSHLIKSKYAIQLEIYPLKSRHRRFRVIRYFKSFPKDFILLSSNALRLYKSIQVLDFSNLQSSFYRKEKLQRSWSSFQEEILQLRIDMQLRSYLFNLYKVISYFKRWRIGFFSDLFCNSASRLSLGLASIS